MIVHTSHRSHRTYLLGIPLRSQRPSNLTDGFSKAMESHFTTAAASAVPTSVLIPSTFSPAPTAPNTTSASTNTGPSSSTTPRSILGSSCVLHLSRAIYNGDSFYISFHHAIQPLHRRKPLYFLRLGRCRDFWRVRWVRWVQVRFMRYEWHVPGAYSRMSAFGQPVMGLPFNPTNASMTQTLESTTATTFTLLH